MGDGQGYEQILYEVEDKVATITLNRPDRLNAYTPVLGGEVRQALTDATADENVRVIILTGAGRGFCAGADMARLDNASKQEVKKTADDDPLAETRRWAYEQGPIPGGGDLPQAYSYFHGYFPTVPKPIIAAINGPAAGLGMVFSLYADIRFASDKALFTTAFASRGLIAEHGIDWILPQIVGLPNALDLLLSARKVRAEEAREMGLVSKVFPHDEFMSEVRAYATNLANNVSPRSMRVIKNQVFRSLNLDFTDAMHASIKDFVESKGTEDFKEGVAYFIEKRAPNFTGR